MTMRIVQLREVGDEIVAVVHLDTDQVNRVGDPDPLYLAQHVFPSSGEGLPRAEYHAWLRQELRARARRQLAELRRGLARTAAGAPAAIAGEGVTFS
jgi:hypothetical protein